ncbi:PREDICTED: uncharacterized protein LOC109483486 [Branchiostoma belcheri]|uniref:Uncharacterized protein LOC109483486 n=1 Tax=Branchiostoma belcheri TaxID=7741 RepID=A0A6P5A746_BRABE|nr:PREDICTED: uncharacterized protein LOC109483486 [Branchiostoma belcheri]
MLEAIYVAGNEVEHTSTNDNYYILADNDIPTPEVADVYSVSDPIHAENSAMYTTSGENAENGTTTENSEDETQVKQAVTMSFNSNRKANKSQPHTTQDKGYNETRHRHIKPYTFKIIKKGKSKVTDNGDVEPYAVANMSDHMACLSRTNNMRQRASDDSRHDTFVHKLRNPTKADSKATDDGDIEPYAVTNMWENETYLRATTNVCKKASDLDDSRPDTTEHVKKLRNPPKATRLLPNPILSKKLGTTDGTTPPSLGTTDGTTPPSLGTTAKIQNAVPQVKKNVTFGTYGKGPPGQFKYASLSGLAVSSTNEIFVADGNKIIKVFSIKGVFLRSFPTGNMKPRAMCMGHNDTLWVASYSPHFSTAWFSPTYTQTEATPWLTCDMTGFGSSKHTTLPRHVTVDKKGNIFIADSREHHVEKYDKNGVYLSSFGSRGTGAGNLYFPQGICVDSSGRVIVADSRNSRVDMFTAEGNHIRTVAYLTRPKHVATGGEGQLVVSHQHDFITIYPNY